MQHGFKIDRTLDFQPFMKSNSFAFLVTERTLSRFFHLIWVSLYCAAQYAKPCEACLSWRVVAALSAWNHSMPPCCEEGLPSPHPSPSYPITPRPCCTRRQVEEALWTVIWMQIPGYALLAAHSPIEETGWNVPCIGQQGCVADIE